VQFTDDMTAPRIVGRYAIYEKIASGGMATVHFGRLLGPVGFSRTVAIKRLHPQFTEDPDFVSMFLDEARLAARIRHANVVPTLDVVTNAGELFLVMEFVHGETLGRILRKLAPKRERVPLNIVASIFSGVLSGLHAAHEAKSERGAPLDIVHRDVSPQNVIIGVDGVARVLDFGVAKAAGRLQVTREGQLKGKIAYMAPEQLAGSRATRRTDVYGASVVLWEALTGRRLFDGSSEADIVRQVLAGNHRPPSQLRDDMPLTVDRIVMRGLDKDPDKRFVTAREMATALEAVLPFAAPSTVATWLEQVAAEPIARQAAKLAEIESASSDVTVPAVDLDATVPQPPRTDMVPSPPPRDDTVPSQPRVGAADAQPASGGMAAQRKSGGMPAQRKSGRMQVPLTPSELPTQLNVERSDTTTREVVAVVPASQATTAAVSSTAVFEPATTGSGSRKALLVGVVLVGLVLVVLLLASLLGTSAPAGTVGATPAASDSAAAREPAPSASVEPQAQATVATPSSESPASASAPPSIASHAPSASAERLRPGGARPPAVSPQTTTAPAATKRAPPPAATKGAVVFTNPG
jgi:serine/threonine-protein kinase